MQQVRWKEPEIVNEIEKQRALEERPQRMRKAAIRFLIASAIFALLFGGVHCLTRFQNPRSAFDWIIFLCLWLPCCCPDIFTVWIGTPRSADACCITELGVSRLNAGENLAWRDLENYRFENGAGAPDLRFLVVEARKRKKPLRLYYEGENLEAQLREAMQQGVGAAVV